MNNPLKANVSSSAGTGQCPVAQDYGALQDRSQDEIDPFIMSGQYTITPQASRSLENIGLLTGVSASEGHGFVPKLPMHTFSGGVFLNGRQYKPPLPPYPHRSMPYINNGNTNYFELNIHPYPAGNCTYEAIDPEIQDRRMSDRKKILVDNVQTGDLRSITESQLGFNQEQNEQQTLNSRVPNRGTVDQVDVSRMYFPPTPNAHSFRPNLVSFPNGTFWPPQLPEFARGAKLPFQGRAVGNSPKSQSYVSNDGGMAMIGNNMISGVSVRPSNMLPNTAMSYDTYDDAFNSIEGTNMKISIEAKETSSGTPMKNSVTGLYFDSLSSATEAFPAPEWHYPQPDNSIPTTLEQTMGIVIQIRDAMLNIDGIYDKGTSPVLQNRWMSNSNFYGEARVEKVAWEMTDLMIRLHIEGPKILNIDDPAAIQKAQKEKNLTFQARLEKVVHVLHHYKARCDHVMGGEGPRKALIMAPTQIGANCSANRINNDHRQGRLKKSRELEEKGGSTNNGKRKYTRRTKQTYTASPSNTSGFPFSPILSSSPNRSNKSASLSVHDRREIPNKESGTLRGSGNLSKYINSPENEPDDQPPPRGDDELTGGMSSIHDGFLRESRIRPDNGKSSNLSPATDLGSSTRYQTRGSMRNSAGQLNSTEPTNKRRREETKNEQNEAPVMKRGRGRPRKSR
ncbi:hypothetical protein BS50DRAFT_636235 [Corynespora cassiicola Philippines]|uniref:Uncharacterized protein n=1 Tax=Corynespora cassiicola Philippines TaxID=1448308 RepID=A0A2T2NJ59_CORCC|nr:hypothetical protein BS50DRAFT_636235 [Corynespora cassiicola Philippines]